MLDDHSVSQQSIRSSRASTKLTNSVLRRRRCLLYDGHLFWEDAHPDAYRPFSAQGVAAATACCTVDIRTQPVPDQEHHPGESCALSPAQCGNVRATAAAGDGCRATPMERRPWIKWSNWKFGCNRRRFQTAGLATVKTGISWW